jgi:hypothetical protein
MSTACFGLLLDFVDYRAKHACCPQPSKEPLPRCAILTLRDALALQHENVPKISESDPLRDQQQKAQDPSDPPAPQHQDAYSE